MPRGGTWGYHGGWGSKKKISQKFNQIWCVNDLHELHNAQAQCFGSLAPGALGGGEGQKFNFLNMVMWHIKLKMSRPGNTEKK